MTAVPVPPADRAADVAARLRKLQSIREKLACEVWEIWLSTPDGRRYLAEPPSPEGAARGWHWVACQVYVMAGVISGEDPPATPPASIITPATPATPEPEAPKTS